MIYLDNSATSYPKPQQVLTKTVSAMKNLSFNSGRGGYKESLLAAEKIYDVREKTGRMFGFQPERIVFTKNCTEALNMAINGIVEVGDHIIISSLEHNSVARVAEKLHKDGVIEYDTAKYSFDEEETVRNFKKLIRHNTSLIVCIHSSNVFGVSFPIAKIGKLCRQNGVKFIVDAAQGAGIADIDAVRDHIDILCAPGHKCLFGTMGTGFLAVGEGVNLKPFEVGGTGSSSLSLTQPDILPDKLEAGTLNNSGIISMGEGIDFINRVGMNRIYRHEMAMCAHLYSEMEKMHGIKLYTPNPSKIRTMPILSFNIDGKSSEAVAASLAKNGICVRAGYHCAPLAHRHFKTDVGGTVRVSPGYFNTEQECYKFLNNIKNLTF